MAEITFFSLEVYLLRRSPFSPAFSVFAHARPFLFLQEDPLIRVLMSDLSVQATLYLYFCRCKAANSIVFLLD